MLVGLNATVTGIGSRRLTVLTRRALRLLFAQRGAQVSPRTAALAPVPTDLDLSDPRRAQSSADALAEHRDPLAAGLGLFLRAVARDYGGEHDAALVDYVDAYHRLEVVGDQWTMGLAAQSIACQLAATSRPGVDEWLRRGLAHLAVVGATDEARALRVQ